MSIRYLAAVLATAAAMGAGLPALAQDDDAGRTIMVTGEGRVAASPDMATIQLGVSEQAETASEALAEANAAAAAILERVAAMGVEPRDVQTTGLSLNPRWHERPERSGQMVVTGYEAHNILTVRVRDLSILGELLDAAVSEDGANNFHGLTFGFAEAQPMRDEARRRAVTEAIRRAQLYAAAAGVKLGPVRTITEMGEMIPQPATMRSEMAMDAGVPVAGGELEVNAIVHVIFEIEEE